MNVTALKFEQLRKKSCDAPSARPSQSEAQEAVDFLASKAEAEAESQLEETQAPSKDDWSSVRVGNYVVKNSILGTYVPLPLPFLLIPPPS